MTVDLNFDRNRIKETLQKSELFLEIGCKEHGTLNRDSNTIGKAVRDEISNAPRNIEKNIILHSTADRFDYLVIS